VGDEATPHIEGNRIENNEGAGIKIGIANKSTVVKNSLKLNHEGILI